MGKIVADVVFISNAQKLGKDLTQMAIDTAIKGANGLRINCREKFKVIRENWD